MSLYDMPEWHAWRSAVARCHNEKAQSWKHYGARGISVCAEWRASFESFLAHIGPRTSPEHSLDRIDNEKGYEPGNVRWATRSEQVRNRRTSRCREMDEIIRQLYIQKGVKPQILARIFLVNTTAIYRIIGGVRKRAADEVDQ